MGRRLRCRVCLRLANLQCLLATASPSPDYSGHNGVQILNHSDSHLDTLSPVGFVHPRLAVLFQPLPSDPPPHARCKDKFLVQSAFITPDEEMRTLAEMVSERVQQAVRASLTKDPSLSHTTLACTLFFSSFLCDKLHPCLILATFPRSLHVCRCLLLITHSSTCFSFNLFLTSFQ